MNTVTVRHFNWAYDGQRGRIAVVAGENFELHQLSGNAPPEGIIWDVLIALGPEFLEKANELNQSRKHRVAVDIRHGMSGCRDYLLREERDARLMDFPIVARLHVSMAGKLNEPVKVWAGDLIPLLACSGKITMTQEISLWEADIREFAFEHNCDQITIDDGWVVLDKVETEDYRDGVYTEDDSYLSAETLERLRTIRFEGDDES